MRLKAGKRDVLRLRRICSTDATFNTCTAQLATYLLKRGYNHNFVTKQIGRASDIPRRLTLQTKDVNKPKRIPFITTFNPSLPHISNIIKKHYNLLLSSNSAKKFFSIVAFRRSPNLRDLLVTAKLSAPLILPTPNFSLVVLVPSFVAKTAPLVRTFLMDSLHILSFSNGETLPIKSNLTCDTKNLIHIIQCNRCNLQYIGETRRRLKDRFNEHRRTLDNPDAKSEPTNDMQLLPIEKIFSNRDSIRKAREAFLIQKGRTINPDGLNIREETF